MPAAKSKISNIKSLGTRYEKGEALSVLAAEAKPQAVDYRTLASALRRVGVTIRKAN